MASLSLEELGRLAEGSGDLVMESVLSETVLEAARYKAFCMKEAPGEVHDWFTYWLIAEHEGARGIGLIGSKGLPDRDGFVEVSYAIAQERRGRGYLKEALTEFLDWLFECEFCMGAELYIREENTASRRAAEACGFSCEGEYKGYLKYRYVF